MNIFKKTIFYLFAVLFFVVPLVLWPYTSEIFEFNKIIATYALTILIILAWSLRSLIERNLVFRRTILDIPLSVFLISQLVSTLLSIDPQTSWLGYYSRFNGGLLSIICYSVLYWAYVSNVDRAGTIKLIKYSIFPGAVLVSIYGVLQHFGIDKNVWIQDVQSRIFSTLGQPNWLAAWLVALMPTAWATSLSSKSEILNPKQIVNTKFKILIIFPYALSALFFTTLLFTKSRSGLLGFAFAVAVFWFFIFVKDRLKHFGKFIIHILIFVILSLAIGTQFSPPLSSLLNNQVTNNQPTASGPALEVGGTESGEIRKIVWKGALDTWKNYPIFGSGVETFAYSYYKFRPLEHNLVSEWDFIYNKAHNEYLNMAANSGSVGLISYLILIGFSGYQIIKNSKQTIKVKITNSSLLGDFVFLRFGFFAGYISILVTNFFGFSVVPTQLLLFLFPAFAFSLTREPEQTENAEHVTPTQKILGLFFVVTSLYLLLLTFRYWHADLLYSKGKEYLNLKNPALAEEYLSKAIDLTPNQALYHNELAQAYTQIAVAFSNEGEEEKAKEYAAKAIEKSRQAVMLSPANLNIKRSLFGVFIMLTAVDRNYLINAGQTLVDAITQAPTDAKLLYNLGLVYAQTGQTELAISTIARTIEIKANYKDARLAYAFLMMDIGNTAEAKKHLEYILENIDPKDEITKQTLEGIK